MCGGIKYQENKIYFPQPDARLPVMLRHGGVTWIIWGKRKLKGSSLILNLASGIFCNKKSGLHKLGGTLIKMFSVLRNMR